MADKVLNTRILMKIDTYEAWKDSTFILKKGELAIATIPADTGVVQGEPAVLIKVGDGENVFKDLPFISAHAADVYGWAKAASKPTYEAGEITGIDAYISNYVNEQMGISVDTDTQYKIVKVDEYNYKLQSKGKTDEAWADVAGSEIVIPNDTAAIEALQGLVGNTKVETQISNAIAALDLANTYAAKSHTHEISEVNGLSNAIADAKSAGTSANAALETYKGTNDAAVKKVSDDLAAEILAARAAEKANADAIAGIKDGANIDSFADVENALAGKEAAGEAAKVQTALTEEIGRAKAAEEANANAANAADEKAAAAQSAVDTLAGKVGEVPADKTVVQMISEAQTAATYDDTKVKEDIQANAEAIALLNDASTVEGSVDYKIAQAVAAIMENPDETMNSINELVTWVNDHAQDALELSNKVTANEEDITALEGLVGTEKVADQITNAIAAALKIEGVDKYALASDLTAAIGRIASLEGKSHEHANKALLDTYTQTEANLADAVAKKHAHENAAVLAGITSEKVAAWDAAEGNAKGYADSLIAGLDVEDAAVAHQVVTSVSETDGKIAVTRAQLTTDDIAEGTEVWVFNCGSASVNI